MVYSVHVTHIKAQVQCRRSNGLVGVLKQEVILIRGGIFNIKDIICMVSFLKPSGSNTFLYFLERGPVRHVFELDRVAYSEV
jgi:hypothetical protein